MRDVQPSFTTLVVSLLSPPANNDTFHSFITKEELTEMACAEESTDGAEMRRCFWGDIPGVRGGLLPDDSSSPMVLLYDDGGTEITATICSSSSFSALSPISMTSSLLLSCLDVAFEGVVK